MSRGSLRVRGREGEGEREGERVGEREGGRDDGREEKRERGREGVTGDPSQWPAANLTAHTHTHVTHTLVQIQPPGTSGNLVPSASPHHKGS